MGDEYISKLRRALDPYRTNEEAMRTRWERDEAERYRKLPARAWPEKQPDVDAIPGLQTALQNCGDSLSSKCETTRFNLATALLFNNVDANRGITLYSELAKRGNIDGMTAVGIVKLEGLGIDSTPATEREGISYLLSASARDSNGSAQAMYELGTALYTGVDGVLSENESTAFNFFSRAAARGHVGGKFMMADCLLNGIGTERDPAKAIPLLAKSAELGHRYARQRMRELFDLTSTTN